MRQVPKYLLIGNGKVARHFKHYLSSLNLPFIAWCRKQSFDALKQKVLEATHILLLVSDSAIEEMVLSCKEISPDAAFVHFSGSLFTPHAYGAHPLTTFNSSLYNFATYQQISFIIDSNAPEFSTLLPGLHNSHFYINPQLKAKYHAYCVLSGNFSCMLWQKLFCELEKTFNIPSSIANTYLIQITQNLIQDPHAAHTGPLTRNDQATITRNFDALRGDPFYSIYQSFVTCYQSSKRESHEQYS